MGAYWLGNEVKNDREYISVDDYLHLYETFWVIPKVKPRRFMPKWTISYHCRDCWRFHCPFQSEA